MTCRTGCWRSAERGGGRGGVRWSGRVSCRGSTRASHKRALSASNTIEKGLPSSSFSKDRHDELDHRPRRALGEASRWSRLVGMDVGRGTRVPLSCLLYFASYDYFIREAGDKRAIRNKDKAVCCEQWQQACQTPIHFVVFCSNCRSINRLLWTML